MVKLGVVVDVIIENNKGILLVERKNPPFRGHWALPGGFLKIGEENLKRCAVREIKEETGLVIKESDLELMNEYSNPKRDPRGHIITHVYVARMYSGRLKANDDAKEAEFFSRNNLPELAFDHAQILKDYLTKLNK